MLTDIFLHRYFNFPIWKRFGELEKRLLNQLFGIVKEAVPYNDPNGKRNLANEEKWKTIHDRLARELGVDELFPRYYSFTNQNVRGQSIPVSGFFGWDCVCEKFVKSDCPFDHPDPDRFIKERISFIELAMRWRYDELEKTNENLPKAILDAKLRDIRPRRGMTLQGSAEDEVNAWHKRQNESYTLLVDEVNKRFRRAHAPLTLHNGFIQVSSDETIEKNIAKPFWELVADPLWQNVDIDMKEALDRRDSNSKDPALFAAKALESAIKIVSDQKGWSSGNEKGASNYIDNLLSEKNGRYIEKWEADILKEYFRKIRNSLGHGPGSKPMPSLTIPQTDWAIENAMSWVRSLIRRLSEKA